MIEPDAVGKKLVAQHKRKIFFYLKLYVACVIVGLLIGLTVSGFWASLINICPACGQFGAKMAHIRYRGTDAFYYKCPPSHSNPKQLPISEPTRITLIKPRDDR